MIFCFRKPAAANYHVYIYKFELEQSGTSLNVHISAYTKDVAYIALTDFCNRANDMSIADLTYAWGNNDVWTLFKEKLQRNNRPQFNLYIVSANESVDTLNRRTNYETRMIALSLHTPKRVDDEILIDHCYFADKYSFSQIATTKELKFVSEILRSRHFKQKTTVLKRKAVLYSAAVEEFINANTNLRDLVLLDLNLLELDSKYDKLFLDDIILAKRYIISISEAKNKLNAFVESVKTKLKLPHNGLPILSVASLKGSLVDLKNVMKDGCNADINIPYGNERVTPLMLTAISWQTETKYDSTLGLDDNLRLSSEQRNKDHKAALEKFRILVEAGADINAKDLYGRTALFYIVTGASMFNRLTIPDQWKAMYDLAIELGADPTVKDYLGKTAKDYYQLSSKRKPSKSLTLC